MDEGRTEADPTADEDHVMRPDVPWPFPDDRFPDVLGAVVMKSVFEGRRPALQVVHFDDGHWGVADGIDDPRVRNLIAAHLRHVLERDPSIGERRHVAARSEGGSRRHRGAVDDLRPGR